MQSEKSPPDLARVSRWANCRVDACRGANIGAMTALIIMGSVGIVGAVMEFLEPVEFDGTLIGTATAIGGLLVGIGLSMLYGGIAGGVIMGVAGALKSTEQPSS